MNREPQARSMTVLSFVLLASAVILTIIAFAGIESARSTSDAARVAAVQLRVTSIRNTCLRTATSALDQARWDDVAAMADATRAQAATIGRALKALPTLDQLSEHGGIIEGKHIDRCPAAP